MVATEPPVVVPTPAAGYDFRSGKAPWAHIDRIRILGTSRYVPVRAGLYLETDPTLGTYYSADGRTYLCNRAAAWRMAFEEDVDFIHEWEGEHTGAVACVNYVYDPASGNR